MAGNGPQGQSGGFDSRAEQAFNQGNVSATGGASGGYSNGGYGGASGGGYGNDGSADPFSFLNSSNLPSMDQLGSSMGNMGLGRDDRRNGQGQGGAKSPQ